MEHLFVIFKSFSSLGMLSHLNKDASTCENYLFVLLVGFVQNSKSFRRLTSDMLTERFFNDLGYVLNHI